MFKESGILPYKSTENPDNYNNLVKKAEELSDGDSFDKTLKKIKEIGIIAGVVIFVIIVVAIVLKFVL